jgi:hypothetical protein
MLDSSYIGGITSAAKVEGYAATIDGVPGGPPLAHWRLGEVGGTEIRDRKAGARHGTYSGTIGYGAPGLPQDSDAAVDFRGTGTGEVNHDAGLALSTFTLSFWFQIPALPPDTSFWILVSKDENGLNDGDFTAAVNDDGSVFIQFQSATTAFQISTSANLVEINSPHHLVVRADSTGFDAYLNGRHLGKNTGYTSGWASNTQPIRFATVPWTVVIANAIIDEVALYNRVITEAEVIQLSQITAAPVAASFPIALDESTTRVIDVADAEGASWIGQKANLAIAITSPPGGGDSASPNAGKDIEYTAGAVSGDTQRSFDYTLRDATGLTSAPATISVTVRDTSQPPPPSDQANCFVEGGADTVVVSSTAALESAVNAAPPGRNILVAPGTYGGGTLTFNRNGVQGDPIVIRPQNGLGTVTINNARWTIAGTASWLVVSKLHFNSSRIDLFGDHNRVTRCRFRDINLNCIRVDISGGPGSRDCRIDHCDFSDYTGNTNMINIRPGNFATGVSRNILIDHCYFHDMFGENTDGGAINMFLSQPTMDLSGDNVVLDHCLFENIGWSGTSEIFVVKMGGYKIRFCTFLDVPSDYLQFRGPGNCEIRSCWFENAREIHCFGKNQLIIGNRFIGSIDCWAPCGNVDYDVMLANFSTHPAGYSAAESSLYVGNRFGSGNLIVGEYWSTDTQGGSGPASVPAMNNTLEANTRDSGGNVHILLPSKHGVSPAQVNTTINATTNEPFTPAVKLTSSDVGLLAPDPLCD